MLRKPLLAVMAALAVAAPTVGVTASTAAQPSARVSEIVLDDVAEDVWLWSEGTDSWELWGTKDDADVLSASVDHGANAIQVVMTFDNLRKQRPAGYLVKVKTAKMVRSAWVKAGPNVGWGGKHVLLKGGDKVSAPGFTHEINYAAESVVMTLPRKLFDRPAWIKVMLRNELTGMRLFTDNPHNTGPEAVFTNRIDKP